MKKYQRAVQLWMLLICGARERKLYTYGQVARILGLQSGRMVARFLGPVMAFCETRHLPPLTVLVVNSRTGRPGAGMTASDDMDVDREKVYRYDWFSLDPPDPADFETADRP